MTLEKEGTNSGMKSLNKKVEGEKKFAVIAMAIFILLIANAGSEEIEKYENLKKENISPEADASLKEYYSAILGASAQDAKFNTISPYTICACPHIVSSLETPSRILKRKNSVTNFERVAWASVSAG